ncbi:hypothetical protein Pint_16841 [Pistacia integerrima]|uniref:Uncharacterized protein n=1 Tax=Pistacia integerrima TaxID=434235 RepID=A0ACC0ZBX6_9ROSI|nr:hypothetical protein Pint_16841 [Pistacia integerrima]
MSSFRCLELIMLECCELFMHLLRSVLRANIGCQWTMSKESQRHL